MFSAKTLEFLFENRLHDSREWHAEHKSDFQALVYEPLRELVIALTPTMLEIDGELCVEPRTDRTICRVRRDTRYSHDKSLYRDNMWIIFKRGRMHGTEVPGLYFEISQEGFNYGCGFYDASTSFMNTYRRLILEGDKTFLKAKKALDSQQVFQLVGDCYKRPHFPDQPEQLQTWLDRRGLSFIADSHDFDLLFSDRLPGKLKEDFALLKPLYDFLLYTSQKNLSEG